MVSLILLTSGCALFDQSTSVSVLARDQLPYHKRTVTIIHNADCWFFRSSPLISSIQHLRPKPENTSLRYKLISARRIFNTDPQSSDPRARPPIILHGRQMPWLLHHHNCLLARPNSCHLRWLRDRALPTHRW
jgi:hypothetical protein